MKASGRLSMCVIAAVLLVLPAVASAQIDFPKTGYYLALGDSVSAGEGALPVTQGFVYQLYERGVFGQIQHTDFSNIAVKAVTADEVQMFQVPQALCIVPPRVEVGPSVITVTAGANDLFLEILQHGIPADPAALADGIAAKVENIIRSLVFGLPGLPAYCAQNGLPGVTVLVSNYYSFDHPDPQIDAFLNFLLQAFDASLRIRLGQIQQDIALAGKTARVALVDTFSAMSGRQGLLLIERRFGFSGGLDFEIHPTNAGHAVIAAEYTKVWNALP